MKSSTDEIFSKSIKFFFCTILLMFCGPFTIYEAFKNQNHPFYIPVLILGAILSIGAIAIGFYSLKLLMTAIFGKKK